jgi:AcrR family transcriptional regulator
MDIEPLTQPPSGNVKVTRADWIALAMETLVRDGVESVKILTLGQKLGVSRSSFYWYFRDRQDLLDQLLAFWLEKNTKGIVERAQRPAPSIVRSILNVFECWADEDIFDPKLDFAVREWARRTPAVRRAVTRADDTRVNSVRDLYLRFGFSKEDALIRARVLYCMQIGYYFLGVREPAEVRLSHAAAYLRSFTGEKPSPEDLEQFGEFVLRLSRTKRKGRAR